MTTKEITLSVEHLHKKVGKKQIIRDVNFSVRKGEVFGFLGPNGAGKTTTIRMLVGLIRPTSGTIKICGIDVQRDFIQAMRKVGSIVENPELYSFLSGRENLQQFARMLGDVGEQRIEEVISLVEMEKPIDQKVSTYSLGMRQRLGIAQALLNKPELLILDEPTNGLDPAGIREMRAFVRRLAEKEGMSVFVSSHMLSEVQMMCDRVAIISHGEMLKVISVDELEKIETDRMTWRFTPVDKGIERLQVLSYVSDIEVSEEKVMCSMPYDKAAETNAYLIKNDIEVFEMRKKTSTLEDLFLALTGGNQIE